MEDQHGAVDAADAPGELALVERFVNTVDRPRDEDHLADPAALTAWLSWHGLLERGETIEEEEDLARVRELREALHALLEAISLGAPTPQDAVAVLARESVRSPLGVHVDQHGTAALVPLGTGVERALATILATVHSAQRDGTWPSLKTCHEDSCRFAFWDATRNRSAKWCCERCANRAKVRSYRARRRLPERA